MNESEGEEEDSDNDEQDMIRKKAGEATKTCRTATRTKTGYAAKLKNIFEFLGQHTIHKKYVIGVGKTARLIAPLSRKAI
jgi:hypothetical protein